ncbi:RacP protein [Streptomyces sp. NPDC048483]|uniref:RacP protein n=1 Tax=Streptomyces sp. NPDC048483 TaxID=3154927 RepID=UPI00343097CB
MGRRTAVTPSLPRPARASDLSPSQVRAGLACLRDIIAANGWPPLIWTRADGYQLGAGPAALQAYERAALTKKLTEFRRFITGTVAPHAAAHPGDKWVKHIIAQLNSIESTLDLVVSS